MGSLGPTPPHLGRLEALVLLLVDELSLSDPHALVRRADLTRAAMSLRLRADDLPRSYRAFIASLSRAVLSLCEKGLLYGYYRAWYRWEGWGGSAERFLGVQARPFVLEDARSSGQKSAGPRLTYLSPVLVA